MSPSLPEVQRWLCPDLREHWTLLQVKGSDRVLLRAIHEEVQFPFDAREGFALRYFVGLYAIAQIQAEVVQQFPDTDSAFVLRLIQKLVNCGILAFEATESPVFSQPEPEAKKGGGLSLKAGVSWIERPDCWILRNPEDVTFLQVSDRDKTIIDRLQTESPAAILQDGKIAPEELKHLLQLLTAAGMLEGTSVAKPKRGKFVPMKLLYFRIPLFNPDRVLTRCIGYFRWIWTKTTAFFLIVFLTAMALFALNARAEILFAGQQLMEAYGANLFLPFILLSACVVTLHELGHALTLKHYGGIVPKIGLLLMCLIPSAYTDTSDSYCLPQWQRILVVGAGVLVQLIIGAIALLIWNLAVDGTWLKTTALLLMAASCFTIALNLNPLSKFDGYYLAVAVTGINNLRDRAFKLYSNLLRGKPLRETPRDALLLAAYAPFSFLYLWWVFGFLFWRITDWTLVNIPTFALILFGLWVLYYYLYPSTKS